MTPTAKFTVILTPMNDTHVPSLRVVEVSEKDLNSACSGGYDALLDLVFTYGQNDFQPKHQRSVSVGDIIVFPRLDSEKNEDDYWVVERIGFRKLNDCDSFLKNRRSA